MKLGRKKKIAPHTSASSGRKRRFSRIKLLFGLLLLVPVMAFVMQNSSPVTVRFFQWQYPVSLALLLLSVLLGGVVLGLLLIYSRRAVQRKKAATETSQVTESATSAEEATAEVPSTEEVETATPTETGSGFGVPVSSASEPTPDPDQESEQLRPQNDEPRMNEPVERGGRQ